MRVSRLHPNATVPTRGTFESAGYDLYAFQSGVIAGQTSDLVDTAIVLEIPSGHVGFIKSRSSLASQKGIDVAAGVIDSDYRGPIKVLLRNLSDTAFHFAQGDRIAQIVILPIATPELVEELTVTSTERGTGGFGSTGL